MKSSDVVGYISEGEAYCRKCSSNERNPIFATDEWDDDLACCVCNDLIDVNNESIEAVDTTVTEAIKLRAKIEMLQDRIRDEIKEVHKLIVELQRLT